MPSSSPPNIHHRPQLAGLIAEEAPTKVPVKYANFAFSPDLTSKLSEHIEINDHAIKLVDGQQPPYGYIDSLEPVEMETLKAYIEINLANGFIRPSKSLAGAPILIDRKADGFFQLCVDYQSLNNLTIKNQFAPRAGHAQPGPQKPDSCTTYLDAEDLEYQVSRIQEGCTRGW